MEMMTKNWTGERLEERFDRIDDRFDGIDRRFDAVDRKLEVVEQRMETGFAELRKEMNTRFDLVATRLDGIQRTMIQFSGALIAVLVAALVGIFAQI